MSRQNVNNWSQPLFTRVAVTVVLQFVVAAVLMLHLFDRPDISLLSGHEALKALAVLACLLTATLVTVFWFLKKLEMGKKSLSEQLRQCRGEQQILQSGFEKSMEEKVLELQVANGALNREIAERIQAEGEIRELQKQQYLILDSAGEGILGLDNRGKVIFVNRAASLMLGWEREELIGVSHHQKIHHTKPDGTPHREEDCPIYMAYKDGKVHYSSGDIFWGSDGSSFEVEYVSTPVSDQGMLRGAVVVFRDVNTYT